MTKDIDFVRLNLDPLATTIQANARAWVKELGKFLNESAREDLNALKAEIEVCFKRIAWFAPLSFIKSVNDIMDNLYCFLSNFSGKSFATMSSAT